MWLRSNLSDALDFPPYPPRFGKSEGCHSREGFTRCVSHSLLNQPRGPLDLPYDERSSIAFTAEAE
jgi:hypothetical protein